MKALIVDIQGRYAVALDKNGRFMKVKNNGTLRVGCEMDIPANAGYRMNKYTKIASIAAIFMVTLGLSYGVYTYSMPYSYIDLDINPSVEITANRYNRILKVDGLNDDGTRLISDGSFKHKKLQDGIDGLLDNAIKDGYLKSDDNVNVVMLTVSSESEKRSRQISEKLEGNARNELESTGIKADISVAEVTLERRDSARELGISPGKMLLIDQLREVQPELDVDELKDAPVREIRKSIIESKKQQKADDNEGSTSSGGKGAKDDSDKGTEHNGKDNGKDKETDKETGKETDKVTDKDIVTGKSIEAGSGSVTGGSVDKDIQGSGKKDNGGTKDTDKENKNDDKDEKQGNNGNAKEDNSDSKGNDTGKGENNDKDSKDDSKDKKNSGT